MSCHAMPCHAVLCPAMLCLCHAMPCHCMAWHAIPCHVIPSQEEGVEQIQRLTGGQQNQNFCVTTGSGRRYVARVPGVDATDHGQSQAIIFANALTAHDGGIAPCPHFFDEESLLLLTTTYYLLLTTYYLLLLTYLLTTCHLLLATSLTRRAA